MEASLARTVWKVKASPYFPEQPVLMKTVDTIPPSLVYFYSLLCVCVQLQLIARCSVQWKTLSKPQSWPQRLLPKTNGSFSEASHTTKGQAPSWPLTLRLSKTHGAFKASRTMDSREGSGRKANGQRLKVEAARGTIDLLLFARNLTGIDQWWKEEEAVGTKSLPPFARNPTGMATVRTQID